MKLENQVTSLEISKKLEKLGVKQVSYFAWHKEPVGEKQGSSNSYWLSTSTEPKTFEVASAFTVAELGEILKKVKNLRYYYNPLMGEDSYWIICELGRNENTDYQYSKSEADARGKMLIYLLENKLM